MGATSEPEIGSRWPLPADLLARLKAARVTWQTYGAATSA